MKLQLMSLNVQGLNGKEAPSLLRNYLQDKLSSLDVLCFQEHKLRGQKLTDLGNHI
jgi:exonuclease III